ncbi:efflux RND transporter periplasmic adaptor subunit [Pseudomonas sp. LFM046]|uniref:efflux RND transporter periplasmic adaptor subunit n=1 Tax=Pseudomonas sp. LFM046 TaxID=1608357 RepID=UPI0005CFA47F|nr:efflux RND transporter periplasmic adaptor subunit [Pseudomonas sp. LFM046]
MRINLPYLRSQLLPLVLIALALVVVVTGLSTRWSRAEQLEKMAAEQAVRTVAVISPSRVLATTIELPGRIEAWARAPIYARISGYLKSWEVEIGDRVTAGQVLAEIETPDLDHEIQQARAELERARSEAALAETTAGRWQRLLGSNAVSRQEVEERTADRAVKQAVVNALQANLQRVQALQGFRRLVAPFDGVVTARNTDVGALINVGMAPGSELFVVADVSRLRVYVNVPQREVAAVAPGGRAVLKVPERPGTTYTAIVQSLSRSIDVESGAMRVQLSVENPEGELLPGSYATVSFQADPDLARLGVPPSALIIGKEGTQVATVDSDGSVSLRAVSISRDLGNIIELADGLSEGDQIIDSPPDGIATGDRVRIAERTASL